MISKAIRYAVSALLLFPLAGNAAIVRNGSFENPLNTWVNTSANYMAVASGSSAITDWTVTNAQGSGVAWALSPTSENYMASAGLHFVDLSGFGTQAGPNAVLAQDLQNLIAGDTYTVGIDYWGDRVSLSIGGTTIATAASASSGWTHLTTTFQAIGSQASLSIGYNGTSGVAFIDNLTVTGREAVVNVAEPDSLGLVAAAIGALGLYRLRRRDRQRLCLTVDGLP